MTYSKLQEGDLELIEVLKVHSPSISLSEVIQELQAPEISMSVISRAIKNRLPSGKQYTRKKHTIGKREIYPGKYVLHTAFH